MLIQFILHVISQNMGLYILIKGGKCNYSQLIFTEKIDPSFVLIKKHDLMLLLMIPASD